MKRRRRGKKSDKEWLPCPLSLMRAGLGNRLFFFLLHSLLAIDLRFRSFAFLVSGNHYVEVQLVNEIFDQDAAEAMV